MNKEEYAKDSFGNIMDMSIADYLKIAKKKGPERFIKLKNK